MRIIPFLMLTIVLCTSGAGALNATAEPTHQILQTTVTFDHPILTTQDAYVAVTLTGASGVLRDQGKPVLPYLTKVFTFPTGTAFQDIHVTYAASQTQTITGTILPATAPILLDDIQTHTTLQADPTVYQNTSLYPAHPWETSIKHGAHNTIYVSVTLYPIRYRPSAHIINVSQEATITIDYTHPKAPSAPITDHYSLLVIAPQAFVPLLQPLIDHKNAIGVKTMIKTTEEIYRTYTAGRDRPEKIKLCIADMNATYGIQYCLLVGGRRGQFFGWYVPERVTHNDDGWETGYASDLYYADLYKYDASTGRTEFDDWDSNHNNVIGEWNQAASQRDDIDHIPDVFIGRLACISPREVTTVVNKIIAYETIADSSWFKTMVCVAGDTFVPGINGDNSGVAEGELECDQAASCVQSQGFKITELYTSTDSFTKTQDVVDAFSGGAGFVMFAGHGNPSTWGTHMPESDSFVIGLSLKDMSRLRNNEKLPIVVVGGCHNSQFNVTMRHLPPMLFAYLLNHSNTRLFYMEWVPECWSWRLVSLSGGGAIATIGCSGLGYGDIGYATLQHRGGWLDARFFHAYGNQSKHILGEAYGQAITDYVTLIGGDGTNQIDRKTIEEWTLFGDPSLAIGGQLR